VMDTLLDFLELDTRPLSCPTLSRPNPNPCTRPSPFVEHNNFGGGFGEPFLSSTQTLPLPLPRQHSTPPPLPLPHHPAPPQHPHPAVSDGDRVALSSMRFASGLSAGAAEKVCAEAEAAQSPAGVNWMEASLEQLSTPLPPWAIRAGGWGWGGFGGWFGLEGGLGGLWEDGRRRRGASQLGW
jgi:hypothetical protein